MTEQITLFEIKEQLEPIQIKFKSQYQKWKYENKYRKADSYNRCKNCNACKSNYCMQKDILHIITEAIGEFLCYG